MAGLMEEVLFIGKFDAGKMELKPALLNLSALLHRIVDEVLSATHRRCPVELTTDGLGEEMRGDESMLRQIFTNLLTNAVKYSEAGSPVWISARAKGTDVIAEIADRGIGIPEADQEWLFSAFHRGRNVGDRPGTGLGLVIVKRCLDLYGGQITVQSKPGEGTCVRVTLPPV
jgi:signal transduction histidine kinase